MITLKRKKADSEQLLFMWMFLMWIIVAVVIYVGINIFESSVADVRAIEANILADKLADCIKKDFSFSKTYLGIDAYAKCGLNKEAFEKNEFYYFKAVVKNDTVNIIAAEGGVKSFDIDCDGTEIARPELEQCAYRYSSIIDKDTGLIYDLNVKAASNQQ